MTVFYIFKGREIDRVHDAQSLRRLRKRKGSKRRKTDNQNPYSPESDNAGLGEGFGPVASSFDETGRLKHPDAEEEKRPLLTGVPRFMAIGAVSLAVLWAVIYVAVNAHRWLDSGPPPIAEWDTIEMPRSGLKMKMPVSTGGEIEHGIATQVVGASELTVRQHRSRVYMAMRAPPAVNLKGRKPSEEAIAAARDQWLMKTTLKSNITNTSADEVAEIDYLSGDEPRYGFRTHAKSDTPSGRYSIEGLSFFLPDGQAMDLVYWTKDENPAAEADAFFETLEFLPGREKPSPPAVVKVEQQPLAPEQPPATKPEPEWETLSHLKIAGKLATLPKPNASPPRLRQDFAALLKTLPEPPEFKTEVGLRSKLTYTSRATWGGGSKPQIIIIPDGLVGDPRYHTLMADFEASGFGTIVVSPLTEGGVLQPFNGYLDAARRMERFLEDVAEFRSTSRTRRNESWRVPTYIVGFGSGGHLAGLTTMRLKFGLVPTASLDGAFADLESIFGGPSPIEATPQALAARTLAPRLNEIKGEHTLFLFNGQSAARRTLDVFRQGPHSILEWTPGKMLSTPFDSQQRGVAVVDLAGGSDFDKNVLKSLGLLLKRWAENAGRNVTIRRDDSDLTPAIAPVDATMAKVFDFTPKVEPAPTKRPEMPDESRVPYLDLLAKAPETVFHDKRRIDPDDLSQKGFLDNFKVDYRLLRRKTERLEYDPELGLSGVFVPAAKEDEHGEPLEGIRPALLYFHGGLEPDPRDVVVVKPFVDAGFHVFCPAYRSETRGRADRFTAFLTETEDAATASEWLAKRDDVDLANTSMLWVSTRVDTLPRC